MRRIYNPKKKVGHDVVHLEFEDQGAVTQSNTAIWTPPTDGHYTVIRTILEEWQWIISPPAGNSTRIGVIAAIYPVSEEQADESQYPDLSETIGSTTASGSSVLDTPEQFVWMRRRMFPIWNQAAENALYTDKTINELKELLPGGMPYDSRSMRKVPMNGKYMFSWYFTDSAGTLTDHHMQVTIHIFWKKMD